MPQRAGSSPASAIDSAVDGRPPRGSGDGVLVFAGFALALTLLSALPAQAQFNPPDTPASSPLWWPLTDDLTPQQLQEALLDPDRNLDRLRLAQQTPEVASAMELPEPSRIGSFVDPAATPQFVPTWYAVAVFARSYLLVDGEKATRTALYGAGVSENGIEAVIAWAQSALAEIELRATETGPPQQRLIAIVQEEFRSILEREGFERTTELMSQFRAALERKDLEMILEMLGASDEEAAELAMLLPDWNRNPEREVLEERLPALRDSLTARDWAQFRLYLLREVAGGMGPILEVK